MNVMPVPYKTISVNLPVLPDLNKDRVPYDFQVSLTHAGQRSWN